MIRQSWMLPHMVRYKTFSLSLSLSPSLSLSLLSLFSFHLFHRAPSVCEGAREAHHRRDGEGGGYPLPGTRYSLASFHPKPLPVQCTDNILTSICAHGCQRCLIHLYMCTWLSNPALHQSYNHLHCSMCVCVCLPSPHLYPLSSLTPLLSSPLTFTTHFYILSSL